MTIAKKRLVALAFVALGSGNASAVCCASVAPIVAAIGASASSIVGAITASTVLLINEIAGASTTAAKTVVSGVGAAVTQSSEMITENDNKITTRVNAVDVMRRRRIQDPCIMIAATKAPGIEAVTANNASSYGRGGSGASMPSNAGSGSGPASGGTILGIARGQVRSPSTEVLASNAARWACGEFASGNQLRSRSCEAAGLAPGNAGARPDADIRAETLFDGPQESHGVTKMRRTIAADGKDRQAMEAYLRNLSSPLELRQLEKSELQTEDGRRYLALKDTYEARMSLSSRALRDMAGHKTESSATIPVLQAMLKSDSTKDYVQGRLSGIPGWSSKGVSPQELRALEAERRHMNPKWREFLAKASEQEISAEQLQIAAYQVVLQTELLEEMGRLRAEISTLTTHTVRNEMLTQLQRQHAAATR